MTALLYLIQIYRVVDRFKGLRVQGCGFRKERVSSQAPSLGRGLRGGVGFLFLATLGCSRKRRTCDAYSFSYITYLR